MLITSDRHVTKEFLQYLELKPQLISYRRKVKVKWKWKSLTRLSVTPWTIQSMEFSRPEYWSGQPFPPPGDLPNPGIAPSSPTLQVDSSPAEPHGKPKNTGVGNLFLFQQIFLTQELNLGSCIAGGVFTTELSGKPQTWVSVSIVKNTSSIWSWNLNLLNDRSGCLRILFVHNHILGQLGYLAWWAPRSYMCYIITSFWVWVAPANMMGYQFHDQVPSCDKEEKEIADIVQISN